MSEANWEPVAAELSHWRDAGRTARFWLRDDDAIEPTPALERLTALAEAAAAPVLLAIIPMRAASGLVELLARRPLLIPAMHGAWHRNHAPPERKKEETPAERGLDAIAAELGAARARLVDLFGPAAGRCYVPPWNRIPASVADLLPKLGFASVSTFGPKTPLVSDRLAQVNTHVDLMDWHGGRVGHPPARIAEMLASALARARADGFRDVGVLAHHLVHDETAWAVLEELAAFLAGRRETRWIAPPSGD